MLDQKTLATIDELIKHPIVSLVEISFREYSELPEIHIQSVTDAPEEGVVSLVSESLCYLSPALYNIDFGHINCWGRSYEGKTGEYTVTLITSTTKEAPVEQEQKENDSVNYTIQQERLLSLKL
jgi:hypothetical protein